MGGYCSSPTTLSRGRKLQMAQMIILPFIPILALIAQNILSLIYVLNYQTEVTSVDRQVYIYLKQKITYKEIFLK
jgi:hypothetical protein